MVKYKTIKAIFLLSLLTIPIGKVVAGIAITPAFIRLSETIQDKTYKNRVKAIIKPKKFRLSAGDSTLTKKYSVFFGD